MKRSRFSKEQIIGIMNQISSPLGIPGDSRRSKFALIN